MAESWKTKRPLALDTRRGTIDDQDVAVVVVDVDILRPAPSSADAMESTLRGIEEEDADIAVVTDSCCRWCCVIAADCPCGCCRAEDDDSAVFEWTSSLVRLLDRW